MSLTHMGVGRRFRMALFKKIYIYIVVYVMYMYADACPMYVYINIPIHTIIEGWLVLS